MHSPEYTKKIKELIAAKNEAETKLARGLARFRTGMKPSPEDIEDAKRAFTEAISILEGWK